MICVYSRNVNTQRLMTIARPYESYGIPITHTDPDPDGVLNTPDDTGRSMTFHEFPVALRGAAFETATVITELNGSHTYKVAAARRLTSGRQLNASLQPIFQGNNNVTAIVPPRLAILGASYSF